MRNTPNADRELLALCLEWHARKKEADALYERANLLEKACRAATPPVPEELYEPIRICPMANATPYDFSPSERKPWCVKRLQKILERPDGKMFSPTPEAREHIKRIIRLSEEHDAEVARIWEPVVRVVEPAQEIDALAWELYNKIAKSEAGTLDGLAAQAKVLTTARVFEHSECEATKALMLNIANGLQALAGDETPRAAA
jgi:hypothetical protein